MLLAALLAAPTLRAEGLDCGARRVVTEGQVERCEGGFAARTAPSTLSLGEKIGWGAAIGLAAGLDLRTTRAAEARGGLEANPLVNIVGVGGRWPLKAAGFAGALAGAQALDKRGHRVWARVVLSAVVVCWGAAAYSNHRMP